jgi:hypothetical protein
MKWFQPSEPPIHLDKSCDPNIPHEYERNDIFLDEAKGYVP